MKRALGLFDEFSHIVQGEPSPRIAEVAGRNLERFASGGDASARQPAAKKFR